MKPPPLTEERIKEAVAAAYGDRHPQSRQYERDDMARAVWARIQRRGTWVEMED